MAKFQSLDNTYKSKLDEQDTLILKCFLLVLKSKNLLKVDDADKIQNYWNEDLILHDLKSIYLEDIQKIIQKTSAKYFHSLLKLIQNFKEEETKDIFEYLLSDYFYSKTKSYGAGELQPEELTEVMNFFLPKENNKSVYNPFAGIASFAINTPQTLNYRGEELFHFNYQLGKLRMIINDCPDSFNYENVNSIKSWNYSPKGIYDYITYNPPLNLKLDPSYFNTLQSEYKKTNNLIISETFKLLKENGKMVFICANNFLFSNLKEDIKLKKKLVDENNLEAIIALPSRVLQSTAIQINIVVASKRKNNHILFIDASELYKKYNPKSIILDSEKIIKLIDQKDNTEFSRLIDKTKIIENDFQLNVTRYVFEDLETNFEKGWKIMSLKDLIKPIELPKYADVNLGKLVGYRDLSDNRFHFRTSFSEVEIKEINKNVYKLKSNTLLLARTGLSLKPTYFTSNSEPIYYSPQDIFAFEINEKLIQPEYLVLEFEKESFKRKLNRGFSFSIIHNLNKKSFLNIQISVPSIEEQDSIRYNLKEDVLKRKQEELINLSQEYGINVADENSFLRHQIAGRLKNIRGAFFSLKTIIEEQVNVQLPDLYEFKKEEKLPNTFKTYMDIIERDLASINNSVKSVGTSIEILESNAEKINLINFVSDYLGELEGRSKNNFIIDLNIDETLLNESNIKGIFINGDRDLLTKMLDNVIDNIEKHGFQNSPVHKRRIAIEFMYDFENNNVQIDFANTGNPLPENLDYETFIRKGSALGENAGDGTGVNFIYEVMKKHNGKFGFTDETDVEGVNMERDINEIVTSIELTFPITVELKK